MWREGSEDDPVELLPKKWSDAAGRGNSLGHWSVVNTLGGAAVQVEQSIERTF